MEEKLIDELLSLFLGYSGVFRASIQPKKLELAKKINVNVKFDDEIIRESLLEHVGHLPFTAVTIFPYMKNSEVNLGDALIMLSIHDIGELKTGDIQTFIKSTTDSSAEQKLALDMLDPYFHKLYLEIEELKSPTAKFAKSIDKIVPDILDLLTPVDILVDVYNLYGIAKEQIVLKKKEKKSLFMTWDPFLESFYKQLLARIEKKFE